MAFKKEEYSQEVFYAHGGLGDMSGKSADNAKAMADSDAIAIPAGLLLEKCFVIVDVAITGVTAIDVGDDDDADGFVPTASITLGTPGIYGWNAKAAGAYLRVQTAGVTDAADIYVVPNAKYYAADGKEVKVDFTTASSAGSMRVVIKGHLLSA
jgi:hypothetical protein